MSEEVSPDSGVDGAGPGTVFQQYLEACGGIENQLGSIDELFVDMAASATVRDPLETEDEWLDRVRRKAVVLRSRFDVV